MVVVIVVVVVATATVAATTVVPVVVVPVVVVAIWSSYTRPLRRSHSRSSRSRELQGADAAACEGCSIDSCESCLEFSPRRWNRGRCRNPRRLLALVLTSTSGGRGFVVGAGMTFLVENVFGTAAFGISFIGI
jgi:hypothetical protein